MQPYRRYENRTVKRQNNLTENSYGVSIVQATHVVNDKNSNTVHVVEKCTDLQLCVLCWRWASQTTDSVGNTFFQEGWREEGGRSEVKRQYTT